MAKGSKQKAIPYLPMTDEAQEAEMIALSMAEAKKRIKNGTASNQLLLHFLQQGSSKAKIEKDILMNKSELLKEQTSAIAESRKTAVDYEAAIKAMQKYGSTTFSGS